MTIVYQIQCLTCLAYLENKLGWLYLNFCFSFCFGNHNLNLDCVKVCWFACCWVLNFLLSIKSVLAVCFSCFKCSYSKKKKKKKAFRAYTSRFSLHSVIWETCIQAKMQQWELDMELWTVSIGKQWERSLSRLYSVTLFT